MTESTDDTPLTLAGRLEDEARSVTGRDLQRVSGFLYETLGRWYELKLGGTPPAIEPPDIVIRPRMAAEPGLSTALLDPGDELEAGDEGVDDGETAETPDERDGVFAASASLAQVAIGRLRTDDESWDDVIQRLETDQRQALASALWVGLATEPEARYPSIGQWRRSVDAALRSDAATADLVDAADRPHRAGLIVAAAAVLVAVAAGAFLFLRTDAATVEDVGSASTQPEGPATEATGQSTSTTDTTSLTDDTAGSEGTEATDDPCAQSGPLGPITIDQVSDIAIVVAWAPSTEAVDILLDGAFVDTVPAEAFRYVIEQLPLSDDPLNLDTDYTVAVEPQSGEPSTACATTLAAPSPASEFLIGVTAPTGFEVVDTSATSVTVAWDPRPGADLHNLYLNGAYVRFGDVGGSSAIGDETEFTFLDLDPDTSYEIGIRRVEGPNQSGLVTITASTDPE